MNRTYFRHVDGQALRERVVALLLAAGDAQAFADRRGVWSELGTDAIDRAADQATAERLVRLPSMIAPFVTDTGAVDWNDAHAFGDREAAHCFSSEEQARAWIAAFSKAHATLAATLIVMSL